MKGNTRKPCISEEKYTPLFRAFLEEHREELANMKDNREGKILFLQGASIADTPEDRFCLAHYAPNRKLERVTLLAVWNDPRTSNELRKNVWEELPPDIEVALPKKVQKKIQEESAPSRSRNRHRFKAVV